MTHPGNGRTVFTPARLEALKAHWEAGLDAEEIAQRLNALPSAYPVSGAMAVRHKASALGLKRPEGWLLSRKRAAAPVTWSVDRLELLRSLINLIPDADVFERLNALPGPTVRSISAMRDRAQRLGYLVGRHRPPGQQQPVWTDERLAYLRESYGRVRPAELLEKLQAMPGGPIATIKTVRSAAVRFGIRSPCILRTPPAPRARRASRPARPRPTFAPSEPEPEPAPLTLEEQEANVAEMLAERETTAFKMFAARKDTHAVSAALKIPLWQACVLQGAYRQQNQEAA
jgi:hypothetical protein